MIPAIVFGDENNRFCSCSSDSARIRTLKLTGRRSCSAAHFAELGCWGPFSNSSMIKSFHRACKSAGVPEARVYGRGISYATEMYRRTGDPKAIAEMLMHAPSSRMMDRYTIAEPRLKFATGAFIDR